MAHKKVLLMVGSVALIIIGVIVISPLLSQVDIFAGMLRLGIGLCVLLFLVLSLAGPLAPGSWQGGRQ
jgi:hypothetical protein